MKEKVILVNPNFNLGFGGAYLDPWTHYGLVKTVFEKNNGQYSIKVYDQRKRKYFDPNVSESRFNEIYNLLMRRGWKKMTK